MKHAHEIRLMWQGMDAENLCVFHRQSFSKF